MKEQTEKQDSPSQFLKTDRSKTKSNAIEVPSITLPKGGGAIRGIDEKFSVNSVNGTAAFSVPLPVSPARGVSPDLSLSYNSGAGNGVFGLGWSLGINTIKRKTDQELPKYLDEDDSDTFLISEAEDLVPEFEKNKLPEPDGSFKFVLDEKGDYVIFKDDDSHEFYSIRRYRPRIEGLFARIERWQNKISKEIKWRVISKENITTLYGWSDQSRLADLADPRRIFEWYPEFVFDDKGNCARYIYKHENSSGIDTSLVHNRNRLENGEITYANLYLEKALYGNKIPYKKFDDPYPAETDYLFQVIFDYGEYPSIIPGNVINEWDFIKNAPVTALKEWEFRMDPFSVYKAGFEIRTTRLCRRILLIHFFLELPGGSALVKSMDFDYDQSLEGFTYLKAITACGYIKDKSGKYSQKSLPPAEFEYRKHEWDYSINSVSEKDLVHAPAGLDESLYQLTDLFNEGLSGILTEQVNGWYYKRNLGDGNFEQAKLVSPKPSFSGLGNRLQLVDLDTDGGKQLVNLNSEPKGFFELSDENEWQSFRTFENLPNVNMRDVNSRMIDLNGDGKADLLITEDDAFTWYESSGRKGFAESHKTVKSFNEEAGPHIIFSDPEQSIFLADMSGDGMTDIVRIRNSEVCYWPNLGYGRFGKKVCMDLSPVFDNPCSFNPSNLRLADIDGSGTTDIIYLGKNKFTCWMNLNGNGFSAKPLGIDPFPEINNQVKVSVADLLGNGVACIVWSSSLAKDARAPLKYIDLLKGKKPHLMTSYKNNLGKEVSLTYTPSTKFYLEDKKAGKPWATKLHFPVHCISEIVTKDKITGWRFVSSYKYHHGYYDHAEREFRGFGMVEQIDSEHFEHWAKSGSTNIADKELHQEPVFTKSWFHTGAFLNGKNMLNQFAHEYWYEEMSRQGFTAENHEAPLPDAQLIAARGIDGSVIDRLSTGEWQEALRACKGMPLRSEIFAHDAPLQGATPRHIRKELTPYYVAAHNCVIELVQPMGMNKYAVFLVKESESVTYSYERNTADPRIAHNLNLRLDEYGNVLESASVVYPRLNPVITLPTETLDAQSKTTILFTQNIFTNYISGEDSHRVRMPAETKTYELKGLTKTGAISGTGLTFHSKNDFNGILIASDETGYHDVNAIPAEGHSQKRLIEHIRTVYYRDDLTEALLPGQLESLALPFESYQLAFTPDLLGDIFGPVNSTGSRINDSLMGNEGGFVHGIDENGNSDTNWWIRSGKASYIGVTETVSDAKDRFYVPICYIDPYNARTSIKYYKDYYLLIEETEDELKNKTRVDLFNFRTLAPQRMIDINGNSSEAISDELGLIKAVALMGKGSQADELIPLTEETTDPEKTSILEFFTVANAPGICDSSDLHEKAKGLLLNATARYLYDFDAYTLTGKPAVTVSVARESHYRKEDGSLNPASRLQLSFEYSNGLGKVIMKKFQAEPGPAKLVAIDSQNTMVISEQDTSPLLRWIGNGRTILNNKGNAVKQYEPFFSVSPKFENEKELVEAGVTPIMFYDAMGRLVKTIMPDKTFSRTEFDSWKQLIYDQNDTAKDSEWYSRRTDPARPDYINDAKEQEAAQKAAAHYDTYSEIHLDTSGRPVLYIECNGNDSSGKRSLLKTKVQLDAEGSLRCVRDARELPENSKKGNLVMQYKYDMLGHHVYQNSMDAGQRWLLYNVLGNPVRNWDERDHEFRYLYDELHRPALSTVINNTGKPGDRILNHVFNRIVYGESLLDTNRINEADIQAKNLLGRIVRNYDTGGLVETPDYDFKGQPKLTIRKLYKNYKDVVNWDVDDRMHTDLEVKEFTFFTEMDALGRITRQVAPDGSIIFPVYNEAGLLNGESVLHTSASAPSVYIGNIDYNEKGQRNFISYGNGIKTSLEYDKQTFRLKHLLSRHNSKVLQDLDYTYDPVGNVTFIKDDAQNPEFFNNQFIEPVGSFTYDALYRLTEAQGRENNSVLTYGVCDNRKDSSFLHLINPGNPMAIRKYSQHYKYDDAGNILEMRHIANGGNWKRTYDYEATNNRLVATHVGDNGNPADYTNYKHHSKHGFLEELPHLQKIGWNFKEEICLTIQQNCSDGNMPETTYYQYDGEGRRIRKITEKQTGSGGTPVIKEERIYLSGYELYKKHSDSFAGLQRVSLSLMDKEQRFVMIETRDDLVDDGTEKQLVRYQMHNFIGSAVLELDSTARVISYEEYHPFGTTAYQAKNSAVKSAAKRYRFAGRERDEESGLYYFKARYYACWLGRWLNCDPAGMVDGSNLYVYTRNNPVRFVDREGMQVTDLSENVGSLPAGSPDISSRQIPRDIIFKPNEAVIMTPFGPIKDPVKEPPPAWLPQKGEEPWKKQEPVKSKGLLNKLIDRLKPKDPQPPTLLDTYNDAKQQEKKGRMPLPEPKGTFVKDLPTELTDPLLKKAGEGVLAAGGAFVRFQKKAGLAIGKPLMKAFRFIGRIFKQGYEIVKDIIKDVKELVQYFVTKIVDVVRLAIVSLISNVKNIADSIRSAIRELFNKDKPEPDKEDIKTNLIKPQQKVDRYSQQVN